MADGNNNEYELYIDAVIGNYEDDDDTDGDLMEKMMIVLLVRMAFE